MFDSLVPRSTKMITRESRSLGLCFSSFLKKKEKKKERASKSQFFAVLKTRAPSGQ